MKLVFPVRTRFQLISFKSLYYFISKSFPSTLLVIFFSLITTKIKGLALGLTPRAQSFAGKKKMMVKMVCGSFYKPKKNNKRPEGEDAHFICAEEQTIGVADGVGGWAKKGVDAGEYARELMINSVMSAQNYHIHNEVEAVNLTGPVDPRKVLNEAYENTKKNLGLQGSSTACILTLNKESGVLHCVNVGDSGFMLFRDNKLFYKSQPQQYRFNRPYQLGNNTKSDSPESAAEIKVQTVPEDIVVLGTDGLMDNMSPSEIEENLLTHNPKLIDQESEIDRLRRCEVLAEIIANQASFNSTSLHIDSPFSRAAEKAGLHRKGGKIDDITVIVARVVACS